MARKVLSDGEVKAVAPKDVSELLEDRDPLTEASAIRLLAVLVNEVFLICGWVGKFGSFSLFRSNVLEGLYIFTRN